MNKECDDVVRNFQSRPRKFISRTQQQQQANQTTTEEGTPLSNSESMLEESFNNKMNENSHIFHNRLEDLRKRHDEQVLGDKSFMEHLKKQSEGMIQTKFRKGPLISTNDSHEMKA